MTALLSDRTAGALNTLLGGGLRDLDISAAEHEAVVSRYTGLGEVYDVHWSATVGHNVISPQGSFALGTVVRNIHRNDDVDIDLVALRDIAKTSISQSELKVDAGVPPRTYCSSYESGQPDLNECSRCWTLTWPGMHLDVLPAIPNRDDSATNIWITDRDVRRWLPSNPGGYAAWFYQQMREQYLSEQAVLAKRLQVDDVPDWQVKTTLQQTVQALKRHRDIYFADSLEDRPASVIITTLAALAYPGGGDLYDVLRAVTANMGDHLAMVGGHWLLANPSQPGENFTDSWVAHPERARLFFQWLGAAERDFGTFGMKSGFDQAVPALEAAFGNRFAKAASAAVGNSMYDARTQGRLNMSTGGALTAAATSHTSTSGRRVRNHDFDGGSTR